jgi:hypothetical protein
LGEIKANKPLEKLKKKKQKVVVIGDKPLYISRSKVNLSVVSSREDLKPEELIQQYQ